jgi:hypothetical protein
MFAAIAEPSLTLTSNIRRRDAGASPVRASFMYLRRMARSGQAHTSAVQPQATAGIRADIAAMNSGLATLKNLGLAPAVDASGSARCGQQGDKQRASRYPVG